MNISAKEKFDHSIMYYLMKEPFIAELALFTTIKVNNAIATMGVRFTRYGFELVYNELFVESLSQPEFNFVFAHEMFHNILNSHSRGKNLNKEIINVTHDMIINTIIDKHISNSLVKPPYDIDNEKCPLYIPKEYKNLEVLEPLYAWFVEQKTLSKDDWNKLGYSKGIGKNGKYDEVTFGLQDLLEEKEGNKQYTIDEHLEDEEGIPEEIKEAMIKEAIDRIKGRGLDSSCFEQLLGIISKPKKDYLREIKRILGATIGRIKYKSWHKLNRKDLPLRGTKKTSSKINIINDTSGSMSGSHKSIMSYINHSDIEMNMIQIDTEVKEVKKLKNNKKLSKIQLKGFGGTTLQPAIDLIVEKFNKYPTVVLTDGGTDTLDFSNHKNKVIIISNCDKCPIKGSPKNVKQFIVKEDKK